MGCSPWDHKEWDSHAHPEGDGTGLARGGLGAGGQGLLPEPRPCGRHLGELNDVGDGHGRERGNPGHGTRGPGWAGQSPGARSACVCSEMSALGAAGGWVRRVFLTPHPCKNIPVLMEVLHSARVIVVSRDHCLPREQMVFPSHSPRR